MYEQTCQERQSAWSLHFFSTKATCPPHTITRRREFPFMELSWDDFERLCVQLARQQGKAARCQRYGTPGEKQHGIDIYVAGGRWYVLNSAFAS
jgi:hypothetical protein